MIKICG